jgi:hypothetical protein
MWDCSGCSLASQRHTPCPNPPSPPTSNNPCQCGPIPPWLDVAWAGGAANTSLGMDCENTPLQCSPVLPPDWYADNGPLLDLKARLAGPNADPNALYTWTQYRPACTSNYTTGTCAMCNWSDARCGVVRASDGALLCNYRFVTCRDRRVVGIHLGQKVRGWSGARWEWEPGLP